MERENTRQLKTTRLLMYALLEASKNILYSISPVEVMSVDVFLWSRAEVRLFIETGIKYDWLEECAQNLATYYVAKILHNHRNDSLYLYDFLVSDKTSYIDKMIYRHFFIAGSLDDCIRAERKGFLSRLFKNQ